MPSQLTLSYLPFLRCVAARAPSPSPILYLIFRVTCYQVIPPLLGLLFHPPPPLLLGSPTSIVTRYFSSGFTARSFPNRLATHLLSGRLCHPLPSSLSSFLRNLLSLRHILHLVYRWSIDCSACLHHQHAAVSVIPTLSRNTPIAPCPT